MQKKLLFISFVLLSIPALQAQEYHWKVGVDYFFDNQEYKKSSFTDPQTQHGIWLNTLGDVTWDSTHAIFAGVNLLTVAGSNKDIYAVDVVLYYQYKKPNMLFRAGTFSRNEVLPNYSDFFFRDSVNHFMPLMQGVFWQMGEEANFINAWMDWNGYATADTRESFFLGFSGKLSKKIFFGDFQSYLFHYAGTFPANPEYGVSEQMQVMASAGIDYQSAGSFKGLLSAGIFAGIERDRDANETYKPVGFTARANAEYHGIGTENRFYTGDARMRLFSVHGSNLYWGTPFLRGSGYLQNKLYIRLLESKYVSVRFSSNFHFSERKVMFQQVFSVTANMGNYYKSAKDKISYPWTKIFR